jgi:hypothetical protein
LVRFFTTDVTGTGHFRLVPIKQMGRGDAAGAVLLFEFKPRETLRARSKI